MKVASRNSAIKRCAFKKSAISAASGQLSPFNAHGVIEAPQFRNVLKKIPALGPVAWLMMANATTRHTLLSELEWRVMPALVLDQAKLYMRDESPVGFVSWARMSDAAAQRYRQAPHHLAASDWKSGDQVWLVDVLAPFGGAQDVLKDIREVVFKGQAVRQLLPSGNTQAEVLVWPPA